MKKFKFSLETVLNYRKKLEQSCKEELSHLEVKYRKEEEILGGICARLDLRLHEFARKQRQGCTSEEINRYYRYIQDLDRRIVAQREVLEGVNRALDQKREELMELAKARKVVERLRQRKEEEHRKEVLREEGKILDEISTNKYMWRKSGTLHG